MCGFVAGNIFKNGEQFLESLSLLDHRGTDYKDHIFDANSGWWLGHNRLSIQGLTEESNQPITRKEHTMVYNGELWASNGHTESDTEYLIDLYESEETDCIKDLDGMFAFAIHNEYKKQLVFARDFMGRIPLYFFKRGKELVVASEQKAKYAIILGQEEFDQKKYTLKDLSDSSQKMLSYEELFKRINL